MPARDESIAKWIFGAVVVAAVAYIIVNAQAQATAQQAAARKAANQAALKECLDAIPVYNENQTPYMIQACQDKYPTN